MECPKCGGAMRRGEVQGEEPREAIFLCISCGYTCTAEGVAWPLDFDRHKWGYPRDSVQYNRLGVMECPKCGGPIAVWSFWLRRPPRSCSSASGAGSAERRSGPSPERLPACALAGRFRPALSAPGPSARTERGASVGGAIGRIRADQPPGCGVVARSVEGGDGSASHTCRLGRSRPCRHPNLRCQGEPRHGTLSTPLASSSFPPRIR